MEKIYVICESLNFTNRLLRDLKRNGIDAKIVPSPKNLNGCSYSVLLSDRNIDTVNGLRQKYRIKYIIKSGDTNDIFK